MVAAFHASSSLKIFILAASACSAAASSALSRAKSVSAGQVWNELVARQAPKAKAPTERKNASQVAEEWAQAEPKHPKLPKLHAITFSDSPKPELAYLLASAATQGIYPATLGFDKVDGIAWGHGLGAPKIKCVRDWVSRPDMEDDDVVLFADAYDVLLVGNETEIMTKFTDMEKRTGKHIVFTSERHCFPTEVCGDPSVNYPEADTSWRYLNSGVFMGRVGALRLVLKTNSMPELEGITLYEDHDQAWYQRYFLKYDEITLDTECELFCSTVGVDPKEHGIAVHNGRFINVETGQQPAVVHFPGPGHWPRPKGNHMTLWLHEAFKKAFPKLADRFWGRSRAIVLLGGKSEEYILPFSTLIHRYISWSNPHEELEYRK
eukprot:gnl/TRDRNA2_/TRDRNA2_81077_c0_seq1.p1 gnl/TRDRNA2_/TRDRNA2_81077_c0~~gnl/TRDRNA2_/TRDRNA2_81077_c0_seq1.p1  ORF type:complete len:378 (+),score=62.68 gnl/TRDRNA2_/TRDRNA2_81077_c0_seq1:70-1203(+)